MSCTHGHRCERVAVPFDKGFVSCCPFQIMRAFADVVAGYAATRGTVVDHDTEHAWQASLLFTFRAVMQLIVEFETAELTNHLKTAVMGALADVQKKKSPEPPPAPPVDPTVLFQLLKLHVAHNRAGDPNRS